MAMAIAMGVVLKRTGERLEINGREGKIVFDFCTFCALFNNFRPDMYKNTTNLQ